MKKTAITIFLLLIHTVTAWGLNIPLNVVERAGVKRTLEPVSSGVPISKLDNITSTANLGVFDANGAQMAAQFRVLARYNGTKDDTTKPIRMALVDFMTYTAANEKKTFYLKDTGKGNAAGVNLASEDANHVIISTGKVLVKISKTKFNLFDEVLIDKDGDNLVNDTVVASNANDGIIVNYKGVDYTSFNDKPSSITIEENGPLKTVVRVKGLYKDSAGGLLKPPLGDVGLGYTVWFKAFKDSSFIKVDYRLESENFGWTYLSAYPAHHISLNSVNLKTTLGLSGSKTVRLEGYEDTFTSAKYAFLQEHKEVTTDESGNFVYSIMKDGAPTGISGKRANGIIDLRDGSKGLMIGTRWFWQNWPKGVVIDNNVINNYLWPDMSYDHKFLGGIYKTHEMIYYFHGGLPANESFSPQLASIQKRLVARAFDTHYAQSEFMGYIPPGDIVSKYTFPKGETLQAPLDKFNLAIKAKFNSAYATDKVVNATLGSLRENRPMKWAGGTLIGQRINWYGWLDFGDLARGDSFGFPSLHYGWDYIALLHSLRFNDYSMFDMAEEMVSHKVDVIVIHDPTGVDDVGAWDEDYYRGSQRWESDSHMQLGNTYAAGGADNAPRGASHVWNKGPFLQYLLTGDERYYEAVKTVAEHLVYVFSTSSKTSCDTVNCWGNESRHQTRAINELVDAWRITGDSRYLNVANNIFKNGLLTKEVNSGGWFKFNSGAYDYCANGPCDVWSFYQSISVEGLTNLYTGLKEAGRATDAKAALDYLTREANWIKNEVYTNYTEGNGGTYTTDGKYFPYCTKIGWKKGFKWAAGMGSDDGSYSFVYADNFALLYRETKDISWLNLARAAFKDGLMYSCGTFKAVNTSTTATSSGFLNAPASSYLKAGKTMTQPMIYLYTEWQESTGGVTTEPINQPPSAVISSPANNGSVNVGQEVSFSSVGSKDPDGGAITYLWNLGGNQTSAEPNPAITYHTAGTFTVTLTVTDPKGLASTASITIEVTVPQPTKPKLQVK